METASEISRRKAEAVKSSIEMLERNGAIGVADLFKIRTGLLQDLKRQLKGKVTIKCVKNTLLKRSMQERKLPDTERFFREIQGSNIFIFSNMNPFKLALELNRNKVRVIAKPGDIVSSEIVVPAGNTGIAPGPILTKFGSVGLTTRIDSGTIWIAQDTVVAGPGDKLSEDLATVLSRLGIKAGEMGLSLKAVYEDGLIILGKDLLVDLEDVKNQLKTAEANSIQLAVEAVYPTPETIIYLITRARENVLKLAVETNLMTPETTLLIIAKAQAMAAALEQKVKSTIAK